MQFEPASLKLPNEFNCMTCGWKTEPLGCSLPDEIDTHECWMSIKNVEEYRVQRNIENKG